MDFDQVTSTWPLSGLHAAPSMVPGYHMKYTRTSGVSVIVLRGRTSPVEMLQLLGEKQLAVGSQEILQRRITQRTLHRRLIRGDTRGWLPLLRRQASRNWARERLYTAFLRGGVFQGRDWLYFKASPGIGGILSSETGGVWGSGFDRFFSLSDWWCSVSFQTLKWTLTCYWQYQSS